MSIIYVQNGQAANILQQIWQEREADEFCDVILIAGAEEIKIPAHRVILSRATAYFKGMFTSLRESREKEVRIPTVDGQALKSLIQFLYTGRIEISEDNVQELLETADMLFLNNVVTACGKFLKERLHPSNCLGFMLMAERFRCQPLFKYAKEFSSEHFMEVYKTQEFLKLNAEQLGQLLARNNLRVTSEEHVFNSLLLWLKHDECEREKYWNDLLKLVRLSLLDPKFLHFHVKPVCKSTECQHLYFEVMEWHSLQGCSALSSGISTKPRRSCQYLMGITLNETANKMYIHYYCPQRLRWMRWMNALEYRYNFAIATMGHHIYILGGKNVAKIKLNTVICLNMKTMALIPVNAMTEHRTGCRAGVLNGFLYVVGGFNESNYLHSSVERWNPKTDTWNSVASMSHGRCHFGIAELNKKLYAVGGYDRKCLRSAELYDPDQNKWTSIAAQKDKRCSHGVAVAKGLLYAIGGLQAKTVERYNSVTNQWNVISGLRDVLPTYTYVCTTFHDKVVVGYKDRVEEYDATKNKWKKNASLKGLPHLHSLFSYSDELLTAEFE